MTRVHCRYSHSYYFHLWLLFFCCLFEIILHGIVWTMYSAHRKHSCESVNTTSVIDVDVVVIGAGISGLSAAYFIQLKDAGIQLAVLEAKGLFKNSARTNFVEIVVYAPLQCTTVYQGCAWDPFIYTKMRMRPETINVRDRDKTLWVRDETETLQITETLPKTSGEKEYAPQIWTYRDWSGNRRVVFVGFVRSS